MKDSKHTEAEIDAWIAKSVAYLRERRLRDAVMQRPSIDSLEKNPGKVFCHHDFAGFVLELREVQADLKRADDRLQRLRAHFDLGKMIPFDELSPLVDRVREHTVQAWIELTDVLAVANGQHPQRTRAMTLQESVVALADAMVGETEPKRTREIARRIMVDAGLAAPTERTISNWLRELKKPNGK